MDLEQDGLLDRLGVAALPRSGRGTTGHPYSLRCATADGARVIPHDQGYGVVG
jgi:hypothetical protein